MRVAVAAFIALSLASCAQLSAKRSADGGLRTDRLHGRAYLKPTRSFPDVPALSANTESQESTSNLDPRPAMPNVAAAVSTGTTTINSPAGITGPSAIQSMTSRNGKGKLTSLHFENGKSTLKFDYDDGSVGTITTGDGTSNFQFLPGGPSVP